MTIYNVRQAVVELVHADTPEQALDILQRRLDAAGFTVFDDVGMSNVFESDEQDIEQ